MPYMIYTKYLDQEFVYQGTFEFKDEFAANVYAYHLIRDMFSQYHNDNEFKTFEDYHDALFSTLNFKVEGI